MGMPTAMRKGQPVAQDLLELLDEHREHAQVAGEREAVHARLRPAAEVVLRLAYQADEHVFQVRLGGCHAQALRGQRRHGLRSSPHRCPATCSAAAEGATLCTPGAARSGRHSGVTSARDLHHRQPRRLDDFALRAARQQAAVGDVGQLVAALGLVHVVGGDQHRDALRRQRWIWSQKSRRALGSTPGRGLVQQQQRGSCIRQAASARRCFQPPDSVPASWCWRSGQAQLRQRGSTAAARAGRPYRRATNSRFWRIDRSSYRPNFCVM
jgi:hypothetical protein